MRVVEREAPAGRRFLFPIVLLGSLLISLFLLSRGTSAPDNWTVPVGSDPVALAVAARSGRVFVASSADQTVSMLDARTGATLATNTVGHWPVAIAVDETHGRVLSLDACVVSLQSPEQPCRNGASFVSVLDLRSGTLIDTVNLGTGVTAITVDERTGRVFVASQGPDTVSLLDANSGRLLGTVDLAGTPLAMTVDVPLQHLFIDTLNPSVGRSSVSMFDSRTGALLNTVWLGRYVGAVLSDARAERVLVSSDGDVYLLDARTGRTLRRIMNGGQPLAVDERDGHALISGQGHLRLIATRDGAVVGPVTGPSAVDSLSSDAVAVDETTGRVYVATPGRVFVLDGRSGRVVRALSFRETPMGVSVDAAAHRVFIVNSITTDVPARRPGRPRLVRWLQHTLPWFPLPADPPPPALGTVTVLDTTRL